MIKAEDILNATHGGLDIILDCYPQAKDCVNAKKHFAIRDERTPSASLRQLRLKKLWQDLAGNRLRRRRQGRERHQRVYEFQGYAAEPVQRGPAAARRQIWSEGRTEPYG